MHRWLYFFLVAVIVHLKPFLGLSQEEQGELYTISDRVGEEIDADEQQRFELFRFVDRFQTARFYKINDDRYNLIIVYSDSAANPNKTIKTITRENVLEYRVHIDNFEAIKAGTYIQRQSSSTGKKNFTIPQDSMAAVTLKDGSQLNGKILEENEQQVIFQTISGIRVEIDRESIESITALQGREVEGKFLRYDPNYSRLLFAPTGRPLKKGDGYFSDYYIFFPGVSVGLSDNFTLMGGISILPGADLDQQLIYFAPRIGKEFSDDFSMSGGFLYTSAVGEFAAGIAFSVATFGKRDKCFTAGLGLGFTKDTGNGDSGFKFAKHPIIMLGGNIRLSNSTALVSENWFITGKNFNLARQPFALALRLFGSRLAADFGFIFVGEFLDEGFPVPWLSFVYNFGK